MLPPKNVYLKSGTNQAVVRKEEVAGVTVGAAFIEEPTGAKRTVTEMEIVFKNKHASYIHFNHPPTPDEQTAINAFIAAIYAD